MSGAKHSSMILDGCTAAAHVAYAMSDVATIYPITPVASMGDTALRWAMAGRLNIMGRKLDVREMESELGAAGATHGALAAGALATTFTASQGLLLMIPNMYKIAGELLPAVFHVGCRSLATHALSIFGDHQDVMACRATGFAILASASVQETMDLAVVAHLAAIDGRVPVIHMMDGWRTSNEMDTVDVIDYDTIASLVDFSAVDRFRRQAMNPSSPSLRGSAQNPDVYFQNREAANRFYDAFPAVVARAMDRVAAATGRRYSLFDYSGAPDADRVIVAIGSSTEVAAATSAFLNAAGEKTGVVKVRLYRPFDTAAFVAALPPTVKAIAVLDRTKEPGSAGEPLLLDVMAALYDHNLTGIKVIGGRYGLSSKDFSPAMARAVFDALRSAPQGTRFTVGIDDDVTRLSLKVGPRLDTTPSSVRQSRFYGIGADGTVGATRQIASILSDTLGLSCQAFFNYSAKKSGGYTISQLRYGDAPIHSAFDIINADYVACNNPTYVNRFDMLADLRPGGVFVLNSPWTTVSLLEKNLPAAMRRTLACKKIRFFNINAGALAARENLGPRINTVMATIFLHLAPGIDFDKAYSRLREIISTVYSHEGNVVVSRNLAAIADAVGALTEVDIPPAWADATDAAATGQAAQPPAFITDIAIPCNRLEGDSIKVSQLDPAGIMPMGTTAWEKRRIAVNIPRWDVDKCIQCTLCSFGCPHAAIRPVVLSAAEAAGAPAAFVSKPARGELAAFRFRIQVYPEDCVGCGSCVATCPAHALSMVPLADDVDSQAGLLRWAQANVSVKDDVVSRFSVVGSQLQEPLLAFSGACGGCGETPYVKLLTQLYGPSMLIANATGCSSIWGANFPSNAYFANRRGHGPAWGNSLFEDNAEYGFGMTAAIGQRRGRLADAAARIAATSAVPTLAAAAKAWLDVKDDIEQSRHAADAFVAALRAAPSSPDVATILDDSGMLPAPTVWCIGGDGWAYDIGFAGLDHVLASGKNINILVMDTECYSNTGGQMSKATPLGAVVKYAPDGKRVFKKDLGRMIMTYGNVYVASISLGANPMQAIDAFREAQEYDGPSLVIAYCPCINHGIRAGMSHSILEQRAAVKAGYWPLYRFNPAASVPLSVDSPAPDSPALISFINGEDRYADLRMVDPAEAARLQPALAGHASRVYSIFNDFKRISTTVEKHPL